MAIGVEFLLKASTDGFTAGMATANNALKDIKKEAQSWGASGLTKFIGVAGLVQGFRSVLDNAQKSREEIEKIGGTVDGATASVARFADSWDKIKSFIGDIALKTVSIYTGVGDGLRQIFQNVSAEQEAAAERMAASTGKSLEETRRLIAKANEENSPEKVNAAWDKALAARRKNYEETLDGQAKIDAMMDDYTAKYEAAQQLDKNKVEYVNAQIDLENQLAGIQKLQTAENAKQVDHGLATVQVTKQVVDLKTQEEDKTAKILANEKRITEEKIKHVALMQAEADKMTEHAKLMAVGTANSYIIDGKGYYPKARSSEELSAATTASLSELISKNQAQIKELESKKGTGAGALAQSATGYLAIGTIQGAMQTEIDRAREQLAFRNKTQSDLNYYGEAGARRMYAGDPLNFDAILSQLRSASGGLDDSKKTQVAIGDIRDVLVGTLGKNK